MIADLHTHTTRSDGKLTPTELVRRAGETGVDCLAITDHDSVEGLEEAMAAAREFPKLELIPGIELSTDIPGGEIHMLGYYMDWHDRAFRSRLEELRETRVERSREMVQRLTDLGCPITHERVKEIAGDASIGRPHVAQALLEKGHIATMQEAFDKYLGRNGSAYVEREKTTPTEAVELICSVGGLPAIAHPNHVGDVKDFDGLLEELARAGMVGLEVYYGTYPDDVRKRLLRLAERHGLIPLGGSDFHALGNEFEGVIGQECAPAESMRRLKELARPELLSSTG